MARTLEGCSFRPIIELKLPRKGGLYGIKLSAGAWAGTELESTAADNPQTLGYVGKAEPGRGGLRTRWQREHLGKHSGRGSPRRSWLAVLAPAHDLPIFARPCKEGGTPNVNCYVSDRDGERHLSAWIREHYRVAVLPLEPGDRPLKDVEDKLIGLLEPYANLGTPHPLWNDVFDPRRKQLIALARRRVTAGELLDLRHHDA